MDEKENNKSEDQVLVERVLRGDTKAFRFIIEGTQGLVTQIIYKMIFNQEDRKDIAQDVYLKTYDKLGSFKFQSKLSTWIWQITFNTCSNYLQKRKLLLVDDIIKTEEPDDREHNPRFDADPFLNDIEKGIMTNDLKQILDKEINKLSPLYKTLIMLYHHEELSYNEISQIVQLPEGTIKSYLFRARKILKDQLTNAYKDGSL